MQQYKQCQTQKKYVAQSEFWILIQIIMHTMPLVLNQSSLYEVMIFILCHQYSIKEIVMTRFDLCKEVECDAALRSYVSVGIICRNVYEIN